MAATGRMRHRLTVKGSGNLKPHGIQASHGPGHISGMISAQSTVTVAPLLDGRHQSPRVQCHANGPDD
jgi:hypothetical protein